MKRIAILLIFCNFTFHVSGQDYDKRFQEVFTGLIVTDVEKAYVVIDSMMRVSKNDLQQIKSLLLLANVEYSTGNLFVGLASAYKAREMRKTVGSMNGKREQTAS